MAMESYVFASRRQGSDTLASVTNYDIIGDIHGHSGKLLGLLKHLGYREIDGAYRQDGHTAIFVGDLIDRGSQQVEVLETVKAMVDAGAALCVMGNHEFNALAYATLKEGGDPESDEGYCRSHKKSNQEQHGAFLALCQDVRDEWLQWFRTLPLWLDLDDVRVVHACWHKESMRAVMNEFGSPFIRTDDQIRSASEKGTSMYRAIETLLKGPELDLRRFDIPPFEDHGNRLRHQARISWWLDDDVPQWLLQGPNLSNVDQQVMNLIISEIQPFRYTDESKPLFFGHYWQTAQHEKELVTMGTNAACVDFSAGKTGELTAYRHIPGRPTTLDGYKRESQAS